MILSQYDTIIFDRMILGQYDTILVLSYRFQMNSTLVSYEFKLQQYISSFVNKIMHHLEVFSYLIQPYQTFFHYWLLQYSKVSLSDLVESDDRCWLNKKFYEISIMENFYSKTLPIIYAVMNSNRFTFQIILWGKNFLK